MSKKTDCLLIQSPFTGQGILPHSDAHTIGEGLLSVSSYLESCGFSTDIFCIDESYLDIEQFEFNRTKYGLDIERIKAAIKRASPIAVGVSALTPQYTRALEIIRIVKEVDPNIITIMGGPHVTYTDMQVFKDSEYIDIVVRGEGEWTLEELLQNVKKKKSYDAVKGITFRKNNKILRNPERPFGDISSYIRNNK